MGAEGSMGGSPRIVRIRDRIRSLLFHYSIDKPEIQHKPFSKDTNPACWDMRELPEEICKDAIKSPAGVNIHCPAGEGLQIRGMSVLNYLFLLIILVSGVPPSRGR